MILRRRKRPPRESSEARQAIVEAALRIVEDHDRQFDARAVAKEAGRSLGTLSFHFRDGGLRELRGAVAVRGFTMLAEAVHVAVEAAADPEQQLRRVAQAYVGFAADHPRLYRAMYSEDWGEQVADARRDMAGIVNERIAQCQQAGVFRPGSVGRIARTGQALLHGIAVLHLDGQVSATELEAFTQEAIADLIDGLRGRD
jgi:AcrR family transcriptional regulator